MPRPNPPRKRPRRTAGSRVRADAQVSKAGATATTELPQLWSRRSYAILIAIVAVLEVVLTAIQWGFSPALGSNNQPKAPLGISIDILNPISLLVASLIAPFVARPLSGERRALRPIESLVVGLIAYFVYTFVSVGAVAFIGNAAGTATG